MESSLCVEFAADLMPRCVSLNAGSWMKDAGFHLMLKPYRVLGFLGCPVCAGS